MGDFFFPVSRSGSFSDDTTWPAVHTTTHFPHVAQPHRVPQRLNESRDGWGQGILVNHPI